MRASISTSKELYKKGELGKHPVPAGEPSAGHGWMAELLAGLAADVVRHPLRRADAGTDQSERGIRQLLWLRQRPQGAREQVWQPFRRRDARTSNYKDSDLTARIIRSLFDTARQYPRIDRRLWLEEELRVAAHRARAARPAHRQAARARRFPRRSRCPTSPNACRRPSSAFTTARCV